MNEAELLRATLHELSARLDLLEPISVAVAELFEAAPGKLRAIEVYSAVSSRANIVLSNRSCALIASVIEAYGGRRVVNRRAKAFFVGIKLR